MNEWVNEWMNESEWMDEWMNAGLIRILLSVAGKLYKNVEYVEERHRHRYEVKNSESILNISAVKQLMKLYFPIISSRELQKYFTCNK